MELSPFDLVSWQDICYDRYIMQCLVYVDTIILHAYSGVNTWFPRLLMIWRHKYFSGYTYHLLTYYAHPFLPLTCSRVSYPSMERMFTDKYPSNIEFHA